MWDSGSGLFGAGSNPPPTKALSYRADENSELAVENPSCIGVPIGRSDPGTGFRLNVQLDFVGWPRGFATTF